MEYGRFVVVTWNVIRLVVKAPLGEMIKTTNCVYKTKQFKTIACTQARLTRTKYSGAREDQIYDNTPNPSLSLSFTRIPE